MTPPIFLATMVVVTVLAWAVWRGVRHGHKVALRKLAAQWKMSYSPRDLFRLAPRIGAGFPAGEFSDLRVFDVIYASQGERHRYVFTAEYTLGALDRHRRQQRAGTFCEPREAAVGQCPSPLVLAPEELPLVEQYEHLAKEWMESTSKEK